MSTNLDETELARLEALAIESQRRYVPRFVYDACNAVTALIADVRGLREKVEALEWFEECYEVMRLLAQIGPNRADAHEEAVISAFDALKRAVHADRK